MKSNETAPTIESLLLHGDWVRYVARRLVSDESTADDIAQDSWLAAIKSPPKHEGQLRGWLSRALTNRARERGREESRRREREERAARPEAQTSMEELAQKAATQREVVGHVLALEEPFRSVVLLRFFEDHSPPEISERLDIPLKTVHSRLQRAFEKLRTKLDGEYGDREAWCVALTPLANMAAPLPSPLGTGHATPAGTSASIGATSTGIWIMTTNAKLAMAAAILFGGAWGLYDRGDSAQEDRPILPSEAEIVAAAPEAPGTQEIDGEDVLAESNRREPASAAPAEQPAVEEAAPEGLLSVRGHVLDTEGLPVPNVLVRARGVSQQGEARTAGDGAFELEYLPPSIQGLFVPVGTAYIGVQSPGWATLRESTASDQNRDADHIVVVARTLQAEGWVRDIHGNPIDAARVTLNPQGQAFFGFDYVLDRTRPVSVRTTTDASGRFAIDQFPDCPGLRVTVYAKGFLVKTVSLDESEWPLQVELLTPENKDTPAVEGIVLDDRGLAVEGAVVQLATNETTTGADGRFRLLLTSTWVLDKTPLCAAFEGHQSALIMDYGAVLKEQLPAPAPVQLQLGPEPLSVRGKLLDADGIAWSGWTVKLMDATEISQQSIPIESAEAKSGMKSRGVRTTRDGSFQIDGLYDRSYKIRAYDPETLRVVEANVQAGDMKVLLRVDRIEPSLFEGRLLDSSGAALAGVRVSLNMKTDTIGAGYASIGGRTTESDEQGRFQLEYIPNELLFLRYNGDNIIPDTLPLPAEDPGETLVIQVAKRCHFRIELSDQWKGADSARFLDQDGEALQVYRYQANGSTAFSDAPVRDGVSEPLATGDTARTLVLLKDGQELHRAPVALTGDGVQVLRP